MIQKNVNIQKMLYISRFWLYSKFNNLAKKNHTTNIEKSLWRNFNLQIYHRFNNEKNFSMSFTKNEFFKFLRRMLFTLALKRVLTISNKNIPYIPCCDILQWMFNKEQKTIFILPWKTTIYFFYYVYKIKGSSILLFERIPELHHYPVKVTVSYESVGENPVTLSRDRWHCKFKMGWTVDSTWQ